MKRVFILLVVAVCCTFVVMPAAQAQLLRWGVKGGVNVTKLDFDDYKDKMAGFFIGPMAEMTIPVVGLGLDASLLFSQKGIKADSDDTKQVGLDIPVNLKYNFHALDFLDVFAFAGPRFNIGLSNTTTTQVLGIESRFDHYGEDGDLQRFDFALGVGIGFDLFQMVRVKFGYDWGLLDIDKNDSMKTSCSGWNIGAAFLF